MGRRGKRLAIATAAVAVLIATPLLVRVAFGGDDLALGRWEHAVVLAGAKQGTATVVVVYDAGERDRVRRVEVEPKGSGLVVALRLQPDDDGLFKPVRQVRCVKARVRGLRGSLVAGAFVEDRFDRPVEGEGTPEAGFVLPPLARCRSVPGAVVG